jgi:hypothetical protein
MIVKNMVGWLGVLIGLGIIFASVKSIIYFVGVLSVVDPSLSGKEKWVEVLEKAFLSPNLFGSILLSGLLFVGVSILTLGFKHTR